MRPMIGRGEGGVNPEGTPARPDTAIPMAGRRSAKTPAEACPYRGWPPLPFPRRGGIGSPDHALYGQEVASERCCAGEDSPIPPRRGNGSGATTLRSRRPVTPISMVGNPGACSGKDSARFRTLDQRPEHPAAGWKPGLRRHCVPKGACGRLSACADRFQASSTEVDDRPQALQARFPIAGERRARCRVSSGHEGRLPSFCQSFCPLGNRCVRSGGSAWPGLAGHARTSSGVRAATALPAWRGSGARPRARPNKFGSPSCYRPAMAPPRLEANSAEMSIGMQISVKQPSEVWQLATQSFSRLP